MYTYIYTHTVHVCVYAGRDPLPATQQGSRWIYNDDETEQLVPDLLMLVWIFP